MDDIESDIRDLKGGVDTIKASQLRTDELLGHAPNLATGCPGNGMAQQLAHLVVRDNQRGRAWSSCKKFGGVLLSVLVARAAWAKVWHK